MGYTRTTAPRSGSSRPTAATFGDGPTSGSQLKASTLETRSSLPSSRTSREPESTDSTSMRPAISHGSARPPEDTTSKTTRSLEPHGERRPPTTHGTQSSSSTTNTVSSVAPSSSTPSTELESDAVSSNQAAPHAPTGPADSLRPRTNSTGNQKEVTATTEKQNSRFSNEG